MAVRIVLADDQPLVRAALQMVIAEAPDLEVVGQAGTGAEAVRPAENLDPAVVVMDILLPGMDGIEAARLISDGPSRARILVLTTFDDDDYVYGALRAGASSFIVKDMALDDGGPSAGMLREEVGRLANSWIRRRVTLGAVLALIGSGMSNTEIADRLSVSVATAKTYVTRLLSKLDARDRVQLVIIAYETGMVTPGR